MVVRAAPPSALGQEVPKGAVKVSFISAKPP